MIEQKSEYGERLEKVRKRAEELMRDTLHDESDLETENVNDLVHELRVHQIELEMQNDELRDTQLQLVVSRDQYTELYNFAPVGYMTIGVNGVIEQANLTCATMLGITIDKLAKQPLSNFVFYDDQDLLYHHWQRVFNEPQSSHRVELHFVHANQTPFFVQLESQAVNVLSESSKAYRTIVSDITLRKQSEEALLASNQHLSATLQELQKAQDTMMQQERLAALGQFAAGIAHDFNNILAVISTYTSLLLEQTSYEASVRRKLTIIKKQADDAAKLVQQIVDFSCKSKIEFSTIYLEDFLTRSIDVFSHTLPKTIELKFQLSQVSCPIKGNSVQLQELLLNLINNARDALPHGGRIQIELVQLTIPTQQSTPSIDIGPGEWAAITVSDNGAGIPPDVLPHIFEPFFTTKGANRSGLGLAQVYGLIKQHGGEIEVKSKTGGGTSFTIYLPRTTDLQTASQPAENAIQEEVSLLPVAGKTILIVEDNQILREALLAVLQVIGFTVLGAEDGKEAIELYQKHLNKIGLLITDLTMPNMNGIELIERLHQLDF